MANDLSAFSREIWSAALVDKLDQTNVMLPLVNRKWEGDLTLSKTVKVRTLGNIKMNTYTANSTTISYQNLAPTKEDFTVAGGEYFAFNVDDIDRAQNDINALNEYTGRAAVAMNNAVETKILGAYTSAAVTLGADYTKTTAAVLTPVIGTGTLEGQISAITITNAGAGITTAPIIQFVGGDGNGAAATCAVSGGTVATVTVTAGGNNYTVAPRVILTTATAVTLDSSATAYVGIYTIFTRARALLSDQNVPLEGRWAVISPDITSLLLNDNTHLIRAGELGDRIVQTAMVGGQPVPRTGGQAPGFVGMLLGFMVYETPHVPLYASTPICLFGQNDAISYAAQITEIEPVRLQTSFATAIRGLLLHDKFVPAEGGKRLLAVKTSLIN